MGTAHHWYWTGQSNFTLALAAMFSDLEVVPLTLLTLDAWDFIRLNGMGNNAEAPQKIIPHKWAFFFSWQWDSGTLSVPGFPGS